MFTYIFTLSLVVPAFGFELNTATAHDTFKGLVLGFSTRTYPLLLIFEAVFTSSQHVAVELLLLAESEHIEGVLRVLELFVVVDRVHLGLALEIGGC